MGRDHNNASSSSDFLPLSGGTISGNLKIDGTLNAGSEQFTSAVISGSGSIGTTLTVGSLLSANGGITATTATVGGAAVLTTGSTLTASKLDSSTVPVLNATSIDLGGSPVLTTTAAATTYLTQSAASATYATIASLGSYLTTAAASATYLTITAAASTYQTAAQVTSAITSFGYLTATLAASTYVTIASLTNSTLSPVFAALTVAGNSVLTTSSTLKSSLLDSSTVPVLNAASLSISSTGTSSSVLSNLAPTLGTGASVLYQFGVSNTSLNAGGLRFSNIGGNASPSNQIVLGWSGGSTAALTLNGNNTVAISGSSMTAPAITIGGNSVLTSASTLVASQLDNSTVNVLNASQATISGSSGLLVDFTCSANTFATSGSTGALTFSNSNPTITVPNAGQLTISNNLSVTGGLTLGTGSSSTDPSIIFPQTGAYLDQFGNVHYKSTVSTGAWVVAHDTAAVGGASTQLLTVNLNGSAAFLSPLTSTQDACTFYAPLAASNANDIQVGLNGSTNNSARLQFTLSSAGSGSATNSASLSVQNGPALSINGAGAVATPHVTVDNGSGAASFAGSVTASGLNVVATASGQSATISASVFGNSGVNNLQLSPNAGVSTQHNTLDDGTGKAVFGGLTITTGSALPVATANNNVIIGCVGASPTIRGDSAGALAPLNFQSTTSQFNGGLSTAHNTLDNGNGVMSLGITGTSNAFALNIFQPALATGNVNYILLGAANSAYNSAFIQYQSNATPALSAIGFGINGQSSALTINGNSAASFSGALTITGVISNTSTGNTFGSVQVPSNQLILTNSTGSNVAHFLNTTAAAINVTLPPAGGTLIAQGDAITCASPIVIGGTSGTTLTSGGNVAITGPASSGTLALTSQIPNNTAFIGTLSGGNSNGVNIVISQQFTRGITLSGNVLTLPNSTSAWFQVVIQFTGQVASGTTTVVAGTIGIGGSAAGNMGWDINNSSGSTLSLSSCTSFGVNGSGGGTNTLSWAPITAYASSGTGSIIITQIA